MSISKHKRTSTRISNRPKTDQNIILERVRRIDGQQIVRKYTKTGLLGRGGFANCFVTQNTQTKRKAATKIVVKEELKSHRTRLRLANQIRLHKTLHHQNVVQFYHCFQDKEHVYIFLQLCDNQSLNELIRIRSSFITPQIQSFMLGIVSGVQYIHGQKIIHRDLKLGNIFIDGKFMVKIGDFGLATKLEFKQECKRTVCGTPNYIAPEVLEGKGYHFGVDVWSIGVILYTLFYGVPPFETEDANSTYQRIRNCDYEMPRLMTVPPQANALIQKILVRNPADRPTLQDILSSDFMRLGQGILKQLPSICSRKAPNRKQLASIATSLSITSRNTPNSSLKNIPPPAQPNLSKNYIVQFDELLEDTFYYRLANGVKGMLEKGVRVMYMARDGRYLVQSLSSNYVEQADKDCQLRLLLAGMTKLFTIMDEQFQPSSDQIVVYPRKIQRLDDGLLVRLSSGNVQLYLQDGNYVLQQGGRVFEIVGEREIQISVKRNGRPSTKLNKKHMSLIAKIQSELVNHGQHCKQNQS